MTERGLPYFDYLLSELAGRNPAIEKSFGRHVHWGYWDDPGSAICDDDDYSRAAERLTLEFCELAKIADDERVLDAGCGFGGTVASLNERLSRVQLIGLNIDGRQLMRARQQVRAQRDNAVAFCQADGCNLPFASASFDRVLAVECVFHFPSRTSFFQEAWRVLRPGGILALSDFVPAQLYRPLTKLMVSSWFEPYNFYGRCDIRCTLEQYRELARQNGFMPPKERNVTANVLPTYRYLRGLVYRNAAKGRIARMTGPLIGLQSLVSSAGLLNYYFLSFQKR